MSTIDEPRIRRLLDIGSALTADMDLDVVLDRVINSARELTGAPYGAIGVLDAARTGFEQFVAAGIDERTRKLIGDPPRGRGVLGVLIEQPRPLRLSEIGRHPESFGFPPGHPAMRALLGVPIVIRGEVWGNLYLAGDDGGEFTDGDEEAVVILAGWAAAAIDNALLYQVSEGRRTELERAVGVLEATRDVLLAVRASSDLSRTLELIAKRGRAVLDARSVVIMLGEDEGLALAASAGHSIDVGVLSHEHATEAGGSDTGMTHERLVPMVHRGQTLGMLAASRAADAGGEFTTDEEQLLELFAGIAATAAAMAHSAEAERLRSSLKIADAERRRWARELHDETLQALAAMRLTLSGLISRGGDEPAVDPVVQSLFAAVETEITNLRAIINDLRPAAVHELGLRPALQSLIDRRNRDGLEIVAVVDLPDSDQGTARLDPELESAIYRIVQEGLTNVVKHARAATVRLTVAAAGDRVTIELRDDGVGFDPKQRSTGYGLGGIGERVNLIGGKFEIESGPDGTLLRVQLPALTS